MTKLSPSLFASFFVLLSALSLSGTSSLFAQEDHTIISKERTLETFNVLGIRPGTLTPLCKQTLSIKELTKDNSAWDIPFLLKGTPSLFTTSDNGTIGGYTAFSIRGVDPTRINITVNGIPVNDSESQTVFWANMPDFGSNLKDIVVVRGAGASTYGAGAFGATMDMQLSLPAETAGGRITTSWGMYGLNRNNIVLNTGHLNSGWRVGGAISTVKSNGYIERTSNKGFNYLLQAYYEDEASNYSLQLVHFQGTQRTGISWHGINATNLEKYGPRFNADGWMNPKETISTNFRFYDDQTDNYRQSHSYAIFKHHLSKSFQYNLTLHYTRGKGSTHEYRTNRKLREYYLVPMDNKEKSDLIRHKFLDNHFIGGIVNALWKNKKGHINTGLALNHYKNAHFGNLPWVKKAPDEFVPNQEYYRNNSTKTDLSTYVKGELNLSSSLLAYMDLQYRFVYATMEGSTDRKNDHTGKMDVLDFVGNNALSYHFFLPKVGLTYHPNSYSHYYISYARAGKEPNRKMFTENKVYDKKEQLILPKAEYMGDLEMGTNIALDRISFFVNGYYMHYKNQIIPNGKQSDVGEPLLINVPKSYRVGLEVGANYLLLPSLQVSANATLSRNRIVDYTYYIDSYKNGAWSGQKELHSDEQPIANSPSVIANYAITWSPMKDFDIRFGGHYVGKRHMDNTGLDLSTLKSYHVNDLTINYMLKIQQHNSLTFQAHLQNILSARYHSYGWSYVIYDEDSQKYSLSDSGVFPAAPFHFVVGVTYQF